MSYFVLTRGGEQFMSVKQLSIAVFVVLFLSILVTSPFTSSQSGNYDPWLDYNEDGKIDADELYPLGQAYGSTGDPTKNVTIAGHVTKLLKLAVSVSVPPSSSWDSGLIWIDGYSKVTVLAAFNTAGSETIEVNAYDDTGLAGPKWYVDKAVSTGYLVKTYDVMNLQIRILCTNSNSVVTKTLSVEVYLMA